MSQLLTDLKALRALLTPPEAWTKTWNARDKEGLPVVADGPEAFCWCLHGGMIRVCERDPQREHYVIRSLERALPETVLRRHVPHWQDAPERTHAEVLALIDGAIAREEGAG